MDRYLITLAPPDGMSLDEMVRYLEVAHRIEEVEDSSRDQITALVPFPCLDGLESDPWIDEITRL